jgi:Secretion system C-terminal sorting domain
MRHLYLALCFIMLLSVGLYAQKDTINVPDAIDQGEGTLNDAVQTAIDGGTLSNTVFKLKPYGLYILSGTITTPAGSVLEIYADPPGTTQETAPPMIAWTVSTAPDKRYNFNLPGSVIMRNVWLLYGSTDGAQSGTSLRVGDSAAVGGGATFDNVIFDYSQVPQNSSGAVEIYSTHFNGKFSNCYFRNCTDPHYRYYGRALSFPYQSTGLHTDTVSFENCTFASMGYVYMQEGAEYADNVYFNHCTFYDIAMFTLESGWWYKLAVTNSVFVNTYMYGAIPVNDGEGFGGTININSIDSTAIGGGFGFSVPFTEQDRRILFVNNSYSVDQWLVDWMGYGPNGNPYSQDLHRNRLDDQIPVPMPMINGNTRTFFDSTNSGGDKAFPYMNAAGMYDGSDPGFVNPPINLDSLKQFLYHKWYDNADVNWAYMPENDYNQVWPITEDLSYSNDTLKTAGMDGFPLGDLYHWWPEQYDQWKTQKDAEHNRIYSWLDNGQDPVDVELSSRSLPVEYSLSQNYPNPFNPTTQIDFSIPKGGFVTIKVYNSLGQEVATLFSGYKQVGNYTTNFNGSQLASGVYLYRLESGSVSITRKLVLMK